MKVLMISSDRKILEKNSSVEQRILEYGKLVDKLSIILLTKEAHFIKKEIGNNVWVYPTNSKSKFLYILNAIKTGLKIIGDKKRGEKWLVTTQDAFEIGLAGWIISKIKKTKLHLQVHTDFLNNFFVKESFLNKIRVFIARFLLPKADGIRVVSSRIKISLLKTGFVKKDSRINVLPIFVDLEKMNKAKIEIDLHKKYSRFDFIFLAVSRLEKEKNVDFLIEAFKQVASKHSNVALVVVGDGSLRKKMELLIINNRLSSNIFFVGWQNDLTSYYKTADLFLSASSYEGFGMSLVEAGGVACPILTTKVGIVGEILNNKNSLICEVKDKQCFAEKMIYAVENKREIREMGKMGQESIGRKLFITKERYLEEYKKDWERCFYE